MKEIAKELAKVWGFITLIGALFFVLLIGYLFVAPCFRGKVAVE